MSDFSEPALSHNFVHRTRKYSPEKSLDVSEATEGEGSHGDYNHGDYIVVTGCT